LLRANLVGYANDAERTQLSSYEMHAAPLLVTTLKDTPVIVHLQGYDIDGGEVEPVVQSAPSHGTLYELVAFDTSPSANQLTELDLSRPWMDANLPDSLGVIGSGMLVKRELSAAGMSCRSGLALYVPARWYYGSDEFKFNVLLVSPVNPSPFFAGISSAEAAWVQIDVAFVFTPPVIGNTTTEVGGGGANKATLLRLTAEDPQGLNMSYSVLAVPPANLASVYQLPSWVHILSVSDGGQTVVWTGTDPAAPFGVRRRMFATTTPDVVAPSRSVSVPVPVGALIPSSTSSATGGVEVVNPNGWLVFVPTLDAAGDFVLTWAASNMEGNRSAPANITISVPYQHQLPVALEYGSNLQAVQNEPLVFTLFSTTDPSMPRDATPTITLAPANGTLCESVPTLGQPSPCGADYGVRVGFGSKVPAVPARLVFLPHRNTYGLNHSEMAFTVTDASGLASANEARIRFDVAFRNQPPEPLSRAPVVDFSAGLVPPWDDPNGLPLAGRYVESLNVTLEALDPDNSFEQLRFELVQAPTIGALRVLAWPNGNVLVSPIELTVTDSWMRSYRQSQNDNSSTLLLASNKVTFLTKGAGASYPYANFTFRVVDPAGLANEGTWQLYADCSKGGEGSVPYVWARAGCTDCPVCITCPAPGAFCSATGTFLPRSKPGYWQSQSRLSAAGSGPEHTQLTYNSAGMPVYLECIPASACLEAAYGENGCNTEMGYTGRSCAQCSSGFHPVSGKCSQCTKTSSSVVILLAMALAAGVGAVAFVLLMTKLNVDLSFFTLAINFFQTVGTFKLFKLHWPTSSESSFGAIANFIQLSPDLLSMECWIPDTVVGIQMKLQYQHKVRQSRCSPQHWANLTVPTMSRKLADFIFLG
jgi:hypothetical protein